MTSAENEASRDEERFFALIGYAITRWAYVDRALFDLCSFALNAGDEKTATIFYHSTSIDTHIELTDRLLQLSLTPECYRQWRDIYSNIKKLVPFRNDIAHNPVGKKIEVATLYSGRMTPEFIRELAKRGPKTWHISETENMKRLAKKRAVTIDENALWTHIGKVHDLLATISGLQQMIQKGPLTKPPESS